MHATAEPPTVPPPPAVKRCRLCRRRLRPSNLSGYCADCFCSNERYATDTDYRRSEIIRKTSDYHRDKPQILGRLASKRADATWIGDFAGGRETNGQLRACLSLWTVRGSRSYLPRIFEHDARHWVAMELQAAGAGDGSSFDERWADQRYVYDTFTLCAVHPASPKCGETYAKRLARLGKVEADDFDGLRVHCGREPHLGEWVIDKAVVMRVRARGQG